MDGGEPAVVPVRVDVRREQDRCRERNELDRRGDRDNRPRAGRSALAQEGQAGDVDGVGRRDKPEVDP
jgi:hypothetical protein